MSVQAALLPGDRLHLQHGPIDLVIGVDGERERAFRAARVRFDSVLSELMAEVALLRMADGPRPKGEIAHAMWQAIQPHRAAFVTPMAAVAGAVADAVLAAMTKAARLTRAYVNNGGDIALHLAPGARFDLAMAGLGAQALGRVRITHDDPIRGIATSGRGGRSLSMGIADSVTVLAKTGARADAAATLIANAVDLPGHRAIRRQPANTVRDDSDLGARAVVVGLGVLSNGEIATALERGVACARSMERAGLIGGAALFLDGAARMVGAQQLIQQETTDA